MNQATGVLAEPANPVPQNTETGDQVPVTITAAGQNQPAGDDGHPLSSGGYRFVSSNFPPLSATTRRAGLPTSFSSLGNCGRSATM